MDSADNSFASDRKHVMGSLAMYELFLSAARLVHAGRLCMRGCIVQTADHLLVGTPTDEQTVFSLQLA